MKTLLTTILFISLSLHISGQSLRHVKGNSTIDFGYNLTKFSPGYTLGYGYYLNNNVILKAFLNHEKGLIGATKYNANLLFLGANYSFYNFKSLVYFNVTGGAVIGFENANSTEYIVDETNFLYGGFFGVENEIFIFNKLAATLFFDEVLTQKSSFGNARYRVGLGLKLFIK